MSAVVNRRIVADLSELPLHAMGSASPTWWGTVAFMLIEGTGFALVIGVYLYLDSLASNWPLSAPLPSAPIASRLRVSVPRKELPRRWSTE